MGKRILGVLAIAALVSGLGAVGAGASVRGPLEGGDSGQWTATPNDGCGSGKFHVEIHGAGIASRVGAYSYTADECFDPGAGTYAGSFTMIARSGDELSGTYRGTVAIVGSDIAYDQTATLTGGTGRFEGAEGRFEVIGLAYANGDYDQHLDGTFFGG